MRSSRAKEMSMEITVGAFVFMVLLALAVFTIILSTENIFKKSYMVTVRFEDVMGLRAGDNVLVRGVNVGKVKEIRLANDGVYVDASLDSEIRLREDYRIETVPSSVLGGRNLQIYEGASSNLFKKAFAEGETPIDFIEETSQTVKAIRSALDEGGILENLQATMAEFRKLSANLAAGEGTLGRLLQDDSLYYEIREVSGNLNVISKNLAEGEGTIGKLLTEEEVYNDLKQLTANLRDVSDRLASGQGALGQLLDGENEFFTNLTDASVAIKDITETISSGEGTIGRLVKDDYLYEEMKILLSEVRSAVEDFQEATPVTTFTSIFFGAF